MCENLNTSIVGWRRRRHEDIRDRVMPKGTKGTPSPEDQIEVSAEKSDASTTTTGYPESAQRDDEIQGLS